MSKDITTSGPSRRSIAKGAAWAVPAVSVAAAAPALAASPGDACAPGTLKVTAVCPKPLIDLLNAVPLYFTITNPAGSNCTVPAGTVINIERSGLANLDVATLNSLANVGVLYDTATTAHLTSPLASGQSAIIRIFPAGLATASVAAAATVRIDGSSATQDYTIVNVLDGVAGIAICGTLLGVALSLIHI